ncbi:sulfite oxidase-like oxidoreductase [Candidatus Borrarchaeum sp.]|uniref:sulfite oxidase-like oxidoreductase n=1 Tax=Candidatus Borrarchaeum sp. TaxID=2846742 RepID=UPI00257BD4BA|nr:sulfite oxidase-like oxidoreductase [Candidatus Borrarchaeum sp.]
MEDEGIIISPDTKRENRVPPGQRLTEKFPTLHAGSVPRYDLSKWTFKITGLVEEKKTLSYEEFMSLPMVKVFSDVHCVTGWSRLNNLWEGVSTSVIKELVNILPEAKFVIVHCAEGWTTNLTLEDFFQADVLFVAKLDNEPNTAKHGAPCRLVVPRLYFWKSAKWVERLEFIAKDKPGFWETRGYHNHGDPWKEERYSYY